MEMRSLFIISSVLLAVAAHAQEKPSESCVSPKCHSTFGKEKYVHGPVAVGECFACHEAVPKEKHKFKPITNSGALCARCHEKMEMKATVHAPVSKGQCTACHDPHQSGQQFQIRKAPISEVCLTCHKRDMFEKKFKHGPAADGDCMSCHTPHTSIKPKLLSHEGNELCFQCHAEMKEALVEAKHIHKPVGENCLNCHNPHSGDAQFMLASDVPDQCFSCHTNIKDQVASVNVKHGALEIDKKCLNCHSPHDAPFTKQLKEEPMQLCLSCHNKPIEVSPGVNIANMKDLFDKFKDWHGPIRERDCTGCHAPHGSPNFKILQKPYPKEFYTSFSPEQYDLCFGCHQPALVQQQTTTTLTGFRDGDRNLHFLHVNKKVKGRTCRSCHETHASAKAKHIRESVPFGSWNLPIRFEKTSNGGKCAPGCHSPKEYVQSELPPAGKK